MIAVIADDITGAAEMAGIAHRLGLRVKLTTEPVSTPDCDVLVIATDTRSMSREEAVSESRRVATALRGITGVTHLFKKTDSALRGHVADELEALLECSGYKDALYIPANPSKGRTIRDGIYYIAETPLHETDFSFDPEFPAFSSSLSERFPGAEAKGIRMADATSEADIVEAVATASGTTLLAGAADLFTAFLKRHASTEERQAGKVSLDPTSTIIVCGSTQSKPIDCGIDTAYMPTEVYDGASASEWTAELAEAYRKNSSIIIAIRDRHRTGKEIAVYLRETMAGIVEALVNIRQPHELVIEGGATAFAILRRLGCDSFTITQEIAPGVIRMRSAGGMYVTMKPGSYPWGGLF